MGKKLSSTELDRINKLRSKLWDLMTKWREEFKAEFGTENCEVDFTFPLPPFREEGNYWEWYIKEHKENPDEHSN